MVVYDVYLCGFYVVTCIDAFSAYNLCKRGIGDYYCARATAPSAGVVSW